MPMMKMGSQSEPDSMVIGPMSIPSAIKHDRQRNGEKIDRECPENVEDARQHRVDDAAEEAGGEAEGSADQQCHDGCGTGDEQRIEPAIEEARHDVPALVVGAQEVVAEFPGGADWRVAQAQAFGRLLHDRHVFAVDLDDGIKRRPEGVDAGPGGIERRGNAAGNNHQESTGVPPSAARSRARRRRAVAQGPRLFAAVSALSA